MNHNGYISEMVRTPLRQSAKLLQSIKYSQKDKSGFKFTLNHCYKGA
jgi:hypothetical protein